LTNNGPNSQSVSFTTSPHRDPPSAASNACNRARLFLIRPKTTANRAARLANSNGLTNASLRTASGSYLVTTRQKSRSASSVSLFFTPALPRTALVSPLASRAAALVALVLPSLVPSSSTDPVSVSVSGGATAPVRVRIPLPLLASHPLLARVVVLVVVVVVVVVVDVVVVPALRGRARLPTRVDVAVVGRVTARDIAVAVVVVLTATIASRRRREARDRMGTRRGSSRICIT
tara:strand:+ start:18839 stop:19537 length:699 start_codon:yes stop_codon:yes gene_type:complete